MRCSTASFMGNLFIRVALISFIIALPFCRLTQSRKDKALANRIKSLKLIITIKLSYSNKVSKKEFGNIAETLLLQQHFE
jgi:hypothetical protein